MPHHPAAPASLRAAEFPLRQPHDSRRFLLNLIILPALAVSLLALLFANLLFKIPVEISFFTGAAPFPVLTAASPSLFITLIHFLALLLFLWLLWLPIELAVHNFKDWMETAAITLRTALLVGAALYCFPHRLACEFLHIDCPTWFGPPSAAPSHALMPWLYWIFFALAGAGYLMGSVINNSHKAFGDVRRAALPESRSRADRWIWFEALSAFLVLFGVIVIELYFLASLRQGAFSRNPYESFTLAAQEQAVAGAVAQAGAGPDSAAAPVLDARPSREAELIALNTRRNFRMTKLAGLSSGIFCGLVFFVFAGLPNRLMHATLVPVTFHEKDMQGVIFKAHSYLFHFGRAMLLKNPLLILGGLLITLTFLLMPAILIGAGRVGFMGELAQADEIILALAVFLAWFIPLALAVVTPDDTFGEYFNQRLANHLMMIQGHLVFIGYGDLGKRVLDREIDRFAALAQKKRKQKKRKPGWKKLWKTPGHVDHSRAFIEVVTPDLRLERMCSRAVVIERELRDVVYSSSNQLLGEFGVVGACRKIYHSVDARGNFVHPEKRILVPIVRGAAREPFIGSRVNLERATLVISMVPDEASVQAVFERTNKANVHAIICVNRSDQISYLTYRSRHRPIVLVYPKQNQGVTLGERLWAAMQKVRAVRRLSPGRWPRVLIVGNNKANHYMLEQLWAHLPEGHKQRTQILQRHFAFIVTQPEAEQEYPTLKDADEKRVYDQGFSATYVTGARYPYPSQQILLEDAIQALTRAVNTADVRALEACLERHRPDILLINHEDVEKSLLMLSRCVRALERIKTRKPRRFHLPLLLLAAARGDDWERISLGDASRYYDALCKLHREDLAADLSYPEHAHYDHFREEQVGETIVDALADVEELITGARTSLQDPHKQVKPQSISLPGYPPAKPSFVEVNSCLPNRPGALADYLAELSGLGFQHKRAVEIESLWQAPAPAAAAVLPSFQYLRLVMLDPERISFALSGNATLAPLGPDFDHHAKNFSRLPAVVRVFANDGRRYIEKKFDRDMAKFAVDRGALTKRLRPFQDPLGPGVPQVLDRLAKRARQEHNRVGMFTQIMLDPQDDGTTGALACPAMPICRIAAFQNYIMASNSLRLQRFAQQPHSGRAGQVRLLHARNYFCCTGAALARADEMPGIDSPAARIFCCCRSEDEPGMIAMVLNTLLFRFGFVRQKAGNDPEQNWVINIDYFKSISCQNPHFSLNRLFGFFMEKPATERVITDLPLHLLRILPIGDHRSACAWYFYCRALHRFLNEVVAQKRKFNFYWIDEKRRTREEDETPSFTPARRNYPIALVIKIQRPEACAANKEDFCELCGLQRREYDCRKLRVWV